MEQFTQWLSGAAGIIWAVIALGVLIFFHELGHFIVAKLSGVGVLKFSLGFGRKLVGRKVGETEYLISALPFGGYVKMVGEDDGTELSEEDRKRSFSAQSVWKRFAIVFAGPFFNIILAVLLIYVVLITGVPTAVIKIAGVLPGSAAEAAGFRPDDIIREMDGIEAPSWEYMDEYAAKHPDKTIEFSVLRGKQTVNISANVKGDPGREGFGLKEQVLIDMMKTGSPADRAGMEPGDRVVAVGGVPVDSWMKMSKIIRANPGKEIPFTVEREGRMLDLKVTPEPDPRDPEGGGQIKVIRGSETIVKRYGPVEAALQSTAITLNMATAITGFIGKLIAGKEDYSEVGGPILIAQMSVKQAEKGFGDFVFFIAVLSVNLGIINLVPIPILDGGHLFFLGLEAVMGRPLSLRKREIAQQIGLFILIALMVFIFYKDIMRLLGLEEMWM